MIIFFVDVVKWAADYIPISTRRVSLGYIVPSRYIGKPFTISSIVGNMTYSTDEIMMIQYWKISHFRALSFLLNSFVEFYSMAIWLIGCGYIFEGYYWRWQSIWSGRFDANNRGCSIHEKQMAATLYIALLYYFTQYALSNETLQLSQ